MKCVRKLKAMWILGCLLQVIGTEVSSPLGTIALTCNETVHISLSSHFPGFALNYELEEADSTVTALVSSECIQNDSIPLESRDRKIGPSFLIHSHISFVLYSSYTLELWTFNSQMAAQVWEIALTKAIEGVDYLTLSERLGLIYWTDSMDFFFIDTEDVSVTPVQIDGIEHYPNMKVAVCNSASTIVTYRLEGHNESNRLRVYSFDYFTTGITQQAVNFDSSRVILDLECTNSLYILTDAGLFELQLESQIMTWKATFSFSPLSLSLHKYFGEWLAAYNRSQINVFLGSTQSFSTFRLPVYLGNVTILAALWNQCVCLYTDSSGQLWIIRIRPFATEADVAKVSMGNGKVGYSPLVLGTDSVNDYTLLLLTQDKLELHSVTFQPAKLQVQGRESPYHFTICSTDVLNDGGSACFRTMVWTLPTEESSILIQDHLNLRYDQISPLDISIPATDRTVYSVTNLKGFVSGSNLAYSVYSTSVPEWVQTDLSIIDNRYSNIVMFQSSYLSGKVIKCADFTSVQMPMVVQDGRDVVTIDLDHGQRIVLTLQDNESMECCTVENENVAVYIQRSDKSGYVSDLNSFLEVEDYILEMIFWKGGLICRTETRLHVIYLPWEIYSFNGSRPLLSVWTNTTQVLVLSQDLLEFVSVTSDGFVANGTWPIAPTAEKVTGGNDQVFIHHSDGSIRVYDVMSGYELVLRKSYKLNATCSFEDFEVQYPFLIVTCAEHIQVLDLTASVHNAQTFTLPKLPTFSAPRTDTSIILFQIDCAISSCDIVEWTVILTSSVELHIKATILDIDSFTNSSDSTICGVIQVANSVGKRLELGFSASVINTGNLISVNTTSLHDRFDVPWKEGEQISLTGVFIGQNMSYTMESPNCAETSQVSNVVTVSHRLPYHSIQLEELMICEEMNVTIVLRGGTVVIDKYVCNSELCHVTSHQTITPYQFQLDLIFKAKLISCEQTAFFFFLSGLSRLKDVKVYQDLVIKYEVERKEAILVFSQDSACCTIGLYVIDDNRIKHVFKIENLEHFIVILQSGEVTVEQDNTALELGLEVRSLGRAYIQQEWRLYALTKDRKIYEFAVHSQLKYIRKIEFLHTTSPLALVEDKLIFYPSLKVIQIFSLESSSLLHTLYLSGVSQYAQPEYFSSFQKSVGNFLALQHRSGVMIIDVFAPHNSEVLAVLKCRVFQITSSKKVVCGTQSEVMFLTLERPVILIKPDKERVDSYVCQLHVSAGNDQGVRTISTITIYRGDRGGGGRSVWLVTGCIVIILLALGVVLHCKGTSSRRSGMSEADSIELSQSTAISSFADV